MEKSDQFLANLSLFSVTRISKLLDPYPWLHHPCL